MMLPAVLLFALVAPQDAPVKATDMPSASPATAEAAIGAGLALLKQHHLAEAEAEFQKAVDADPKGAAGYFYLGYAVYKLAESKHGDKRRAAELFAKCYELDPQFHPTWAGSK